MYHEKLQYLLQQCHIFQRLFSNTQFQVTLVNFAVEKYEGLYEGLYRGYNKQNC